MSDGIENQIPDTLISSGGNGNAEISSPAQSKYTATIEVQAERCKVCGNPVIEEGYSLALCSKCRDELSRRTIPLQIKFAAILFVLVIIVSLIRFPGAIKVGIEYERGVRAEKAFKYVSAMKHYEKAFKEYPDSDKIMVKLLSAYYENEKIDEAYDIFDKLAGPNPSSKEMDKDLVAQVNTVMNKMDMYYNPSKELYEKLKTMKNPTSEEIVNTIKPIVDKNPKEIYGAYYLADSYYDLKKFEDANAVLSRLLLSNPDFYAGLILQASTYRELGQYDKAVDCAQKILKHNQEDIGAIVALSKIELKRKNNPKGLEYAKQAYALDSAESYTIANLSFAYHFNNMTKERDENFKIYQSLNNKDQHTIEFLTSIYNGSVQWQK